MIMNAYRCCLTGRKKMKEMCIMYRVKPIHLIQMKQINGIILLSLMKLYQLNII